MFSPHLDFQSNAKSLDLSDEIPQKKKKREKRRNAGLQPWPRLASEMPARSLVRRSGGRSCRVVQIRAACFQLQEELIVLETDEAQAQLDCKGSAAR